MNVTPQQKEAACTSSKKVMVTGGPGNGKTRVLVERVAYLIETEKVPPSEILVITFTRKAANELKVRLHERIGHAANGITACTIHAFAFKVLKMFGEEIGFRASQVTVYGEWESNFLLREVAIDLGMYKKKAWNPKKGVINQMFADYYERGVEPEADHPARDLFAAYIARCKENNAVTYGALLTGLRLLIPTYRRYKRLSHILVDEAQDIDPLQWAIVNDLQAAFDASLYVVCDPDQSIYSWRGAVPEYLIEHQDEFEVHRIETNYRSLSTIVEASNRLIEHNEKRIPKTMCAAVETSQRAISVLHDADSEVLARWIKANIDGQRVAILGRTRVLLEKLSETLTSAGVSHSYIGKKAALVESEAFRRFHAFLKLILNPYDNFSFLLIRDVIGLSREEYDDIRHDAAMRGMSHFQAWMEWEASNMTMCEAFSVLDVLMKGDCDLPGAVELLDGLGWRFDITDTIVFIMHTYVEQHWVSVESFQEQLEAYLEWLATYNVQDELEEDTAQIKLMTVHASKGLEFPCVIVIGCNEGILPGKKSIEAGEIEEERRVMYVAMTRAEEWLVLAVRPETKISDFGKEYHNPISRFIGEALDGIEGKDTVNG